VVVVVGTAVVVVVGATVVVVEGAVVVVVVGAAVVVVLGAAVVVGGAAVVVVVDGAVEVVVAGALVVVGNGVAGRPNGITATGAEDVVVEPSSSGNRVRLEVSRVVVGRSGLAAASSWAGSDPNWPLIASAVPPITSKAPTTASMVALRVLTVRGLATW
jgi:hypothetical protein